MIRPKFPELKAEEVPSATKVKNDKKFNELHESEDESSDEHKDEKQDEVSYPKWLEEQENSEWGVKVDG